VIAYVDSSVILRVVLGQPARLPEWNRIEAEVLEPQSLHKEIVRRLGTLGGR
jgi:hypothetical protein